MPKRWTAEDVELHAWIYCNAPRRIAELALGRSWKAIEHFAHRRGIYRGKPREQPQSSIVWTEQKVHILSEGYASRSLTELAEVLGATPTAVRRKAEKLGLRRQRGLPPTVEIQPLEIWRQVPGYRGKLWASTFGRIADRRGLRALYQYGERSPHIHYMFTVRGKSKRTHLSAPVLLLTTFGCPRPVPAARWMPHALDGDWKNLRLENLRWRKKAGGAPSTKVARKTDRERPLGEELQRQLLANDVWAAANRATPSSWPTHLRDDVVQELVVRCLAGDLNIEQMPRASSEVRRALSREAGHGRVVSLDRALPGTDRLTLADTVSSAGYAERWHALTGA